MFRQLKNIMLKGIMLFALFCILPVMVTNAADNEANPFEGKIYSSGYAYFENAVAVNHVVYRYMPETDSVLAECIDLNSTLKKTYDAHHRKKCSRETGYEDWWIFYGSLLYGCKNRISF